MAKRSVGRPAKDGSLLYMCIMDKSTKDCQPNIDVILGYKVLKTKYIETCAFSDDIVLSTNSKDNLQ